MALFKSYAVIYLAMGAAMYEVLFVFYSYPHCTDSDGYVDNGGQRLICPSEPVSVYDWLINGFVTHEVKTAAACTPPC